ncbi:MAG: hypothetical protein U0S36_10940 [Candidatus Nanopelagicales bacterium]
MPALRRRHAAYVVVASVVAALALAWAGVASSADATSSPKAGGEVRSGRQVAVVLDAAGPVAITLRADRLLRMRADRATRWAESLTRYGQRRCLQFVRLALGVPRKYWSARAAWQNAKHRHRGSFDSIPVGVPVFTLGRNPAGHVVISLGGGWVRSTDWPKDGKVGRVRLEQLLVTFQQRYLGWTEDLNGVRVWLPTPPELRAPTLPAQSLSA